MTEPRYTHDCARCRFLGSVDKYDLYVCPEGTPGQLTGIARYGNDGPEYASRGFLREVIGTIHREIGGLSEDDGIVLAIFRGMPSLIFNIWQRKG